jgi:hypothetical protein
MDPGRHVTSLCKKLRVVDPRLVSPEVDRAAGEFRAEILKHPDIIVEITGASGRSQSS